jgi:hypothetical protein
MRVSESRQDQQCKDQFGFHKVSEMFRENAVEFGLSVAEKCIAAMCAAHVCRLRANSLAR